MNRFTSVVAKIAVLMLFAIATDQSSIAQVALKHKSESVKSVRSVDELLLFFPTKYPDGDWSPVDLRFQDIWFSSENGPRIHGWYCPCEKSRATVLIAHGNAGNIAHRAPWLKLLQSRMSISAFMFDYRGYGRSEGVPTVEGAIHDARAARKKLSELAGIRDSDMLLMGESLGGAIVVQLAAETAPRGLILQSTFSSLRDVANFHFPRLSWFVPVNKLNSVEAIAKYRGPLLQSHGTDDRTVPLSSAEKLFAAAQGPKSFVRVPGAEHNDWLTEDYIRLLDTFIESIAIPSK